MTESGKLFLLDTILSEKRAEPTYQWSPAPPSSSWPTGHGHSLLVFLPWPAKQRTKLMGILCQSFCHGLQRTKLMGILCQSFCHGLQSKGQSSWAFSASLSAMACKAKNKAHGHSLPVFLPWPAKQRTKLMGILCPSFRHGLQSKEQSSTCPCFQPTCALSCTTQAKRK